MSKELNIIEAMKMPIGTQFNVWGNQGYCEGQTIIHEAPSNNCDSKQMYWIKTNKPVIIGDYSLSINFVPIQQPVSFIDAINSGKRIKCVHDRFIKKDVYMSVSEMFSRMSTSEKEDFIPILINEAKWYTEESEDTNND